MKHKHYDCIVAWASGKAIEFYEPNSGLWLDCHDIRWFDSVQYRVKKEPVIEVKYFYLDFNDNTGWPEYKQFQPNLEKWDLKITYHDDVAVKVELPS